MAANQISSLGSISSKAVGCGHLAHSDTILKHLPTTFCLVIISVSINNNRIAELTIIDIPN